MNRIGRLLFPALRWADDTRFDHEQDTIERGLRIGVGGFIIFGGHADAVCELTTSLRQRAREPLLIASDLERGAGQQFPQATQLPPLAALGWIDDLDVTRRAGALTASEALALGINWVLAPVADVDLEPRNPIVGSRAFGADPARVAAHVAAWIQGAHAEGVLCCAKHFPGHGRTTEDSHAVLPRVGASRDELETDLQPFRAAIANRVDAIMTAHVAYDALDGDTAATVSRYVITELLRRDLCHDGLVVTDAIVMEGMLQANEGSEARAALRALLAGCDAVLYPGDLQGVADALERAPGSELPQQRAAEALRRVSSAAQRARPCSEGAWGTLHDREWADGIAQRAVVVSRGTPRIGERVGLLTVDDDLGGPYRPPARDTFVATLRERGVAVHDVDDAGGAGELVLAVYADIRAWKGAPGLSQRAAHIVRAAIAARPAATIVFFGHPRLTAALPGEHVLSAWGGEAIMQRAAARWLASAV